MQVQSTTPTSKPPSPLVGVVPPTTPVTPPSTVDHLSSFNQANHQVKQKQEELREEVAAVKPTKNSTFKQKKQIPTILGLVILLVALVSGVLLFGRGTGIFSPRATPETTPKNIRVSNITDKTFTVSFYTDESTVAFIKYGEDAKDLNKQASDDRDQLSGVVKDYRLHHITVRGLDSGKNYYYVLGTGSNTFDNEGQPYSVSTATKPNQSPINTQTVYGTITNPDGTPAEGAVVYVFAEQMGTLSSLVKSSGSWGISLANAFNVEKTAYATLSDEDAIDLKIQGVEIGSVSNLQTTIALAQPVPDLQLGQGETTTAADIPADLTDTSKEELLADLSSSAADLKQNTATTAASPSAIQTDSTSSGVLQDLLATTTETPALEVDSTPTEVLNLNNLDESQEASATTITTTQPQIKASLPANTMVRVVIHSDTQIDETVQTDADGNLILDVASLGQNLEPGEHTASYTYIDPITGKEVTKTYNFTVAPTDTRQLASVADLNMTPSPTVSPSIPYGSGNPYVPVVTTTPTATTSSSTNSTQSAIVATNSGQYNSGSVTTTLVLLFGGLFFVLVGVWSYFLATSFEVKKDR